MFACRRTTFIRVLCFFFLVLAGPSEEWEGVVPPLPQGDEDFPAARRAYVPGAVGAGGHVHRGDGGRRGVRHDRSGCTPGIYLFY